MLFFDGSTALTEAAPKHQPKRREPLIHLDIGSFSPRVASQLKTQAMFDGRLLTSDVQKYRGEAVGGEPHEVFGRDRNGLFGSHRRPTVLGPSYS
jgi:hypothetical protein